MFAIIVTVPRRIKVVTRTPNVVTQLCRHIRPLEQQHQCKVKRRITSTCNQQQQTDKLQQQQEQLLVNTARGMYMKNPNSNNNNNTNRILRYFPIRKQNMTNTPIVTPQEFHTTLCHLITNAQQRVYLASLYIGPGATTRNDNSSNNNNSNNDKEVELLMAIQNTKAPLVKILLDKNRALRPVPTTTTLSSSSTTSSTNATTITSAEACYAALKKRENSNNTNNNTTTTNISSGIYLLSVLSTLQQSILQNPYNEVCGVFHMKYYIIDNHIIITGANLSQEYFTNRIDRYIWLQTTTATTTTTKTSTDEIPYTMNIEYHDSTTTENNKNSSCSNNNTDPDNFIEYYIQLMDILCDYAADRYTHQDDFTSLTKPDKVKNENELLHRLINLITVDTRLTTTSSTMNGSHSIDDESIIQQTNDDENDNSILAYMIPTFQSPPGFLHNRIHPIIPSDTNIITHLIEMIGYNTFTNTNTTTTNDNDLSSSTNHSLQIRLASAYLNLTDHMMKVMGQFLIQPQSSNSQHTNRNTIHLMTASYISHGFKPNPKKVGNKGKAWIPAVFDTCSRQCIATIQRLYQQQQQQISHSDDTSPGMQPDIHSWYYHRDHWTFHAKGMWFTKTPTTTNTSSPYIEDASSIYIATHGSGNYGERSAGRDMESNIILIFTNTSTKPNPLQVLFQNDWNTMIQYCIDMQKEKVQPLSLPLRVLLPFIRQFF